MNRVLAGVLLGFPIALAALLYVAPVPMMVIAGMELSRFIGLLMLGSAVLAFGLVFRSVTAAPTPVSKRASHTARSGNTFRRDFVSASASAPQPPRRHHSSELLVPARSRAESPVMPAKRPPSPVMMPGTIGHVQRRLHVRAEQLWSRRAG